MTLENADWCPNRYLNTDGVHYQDNLCSGNRNLKAAKRRFSMLDSSTNLFSITWQQMEKNTKGKVNLIMLLQANLHIKQVRTVI